MDGQTGVAYFRHQPCHPANSYLWTIQGKGSTIPMATRSGPTGPSDSSFGVRLNRWTLSASRHYLRWLLLFVGLYAGLPVVAPIFMHIGLTGPAEAIYTIYTPLCHQFAFRSWFLFGEQPVYPRAAANVPGLQPYETFSSEVNQGASAPVDLTQWTQSMQLLSKGFIGNAQMGYKMAICERDVAIYGSLFLGGLLFAIPYVRRRLRPVPLWLYFLLGIAPIAIDGFSQLLSEPPFGLWVLRESTPAFRTVTGALFGLMNAWLAFPYLEQSAHEVVQDIEVKFEKRRQRQQSV